jgi:hypothetical protein
MGIRTKFNLNSKARFALLCLFCVFFALSSSRVDAQTELSLELQEKLTTAFSLAFKEAKEFKATRIFQELGYDLAETNLIASITPRPTELCVQAEASPVPEPAPNSLSFDSLTVSCRRVHYFGMVIHRVKFGFPGAVLNKTSLQQGKLRFLKAQEITLAVEVSEADIIAAFNLFLQARSLRRLKMSFNEDTCRLTGTVPMGLFPMSFEVLGTVELANPKQINFLCERLAINRQIQPRNFVIPIFAAINPVFDSSQVWLNLDLLDLKVVKGFVRSTGVIRPKNYKQ